MNKWLKIKGKTYQAKVDEVNNLFTGIRNAKSPRCEWTAPLAQWTDKQIKGTNSLKLSLNEFAHLKRMVTDLSDNLIVNRGNEGEILLECQNTFVADYLEILENKANDLKLEITAELIEEKQFPIDEFVHWYEEARKLPPEQFNEELGSFWGDVWKNAGMGAGYGAGAGALAGGVPTGGMGTFAGAGLGGLAGGLLGGLYGGGSHLLKRVWQYRQTQRNYEHTKEKALESLKKLKELSKGFEQDPNFIQSLDSMIDQLGTARAYRVAGAKPTDADAEPGQSVEPRRKGKAVNAIAAAPKEPMPGPGPGPDDEGEPVPADAGIPEPTAPAATHTPVSSAPTAPTVAHKPTATHTPVSSAPTVAHKPTATHTPVSSAPTVAHKPTATAAAPMSAPKPASMPSPAAPVAAKSLISPPPIPPSPKSLEAKAKRARKKKEEPVEEPLPKIPGETHPIHPDMAASMPEPKPKDKEAIPEPTAEVPSEKPVEPTAEAPPDKTVGDPAELPPVEPDHLATLKDDKSLLDYYEKIKGDEKKLARLGMSLMYAGKHDKDLLDEPIDYNHFVDNLKEFDKGESDPSPEHGAEAKQVAADFINHLKKKEETKALGSSGTPTEPKATLPEETPVVKKKANEEILADLENSSKFMQMSKEDFKQFVTDNDLLDHVKDEHGKAFFGKDNSANRFMAIQQIKNALGGKKPEPAPDTPKVEPSTGQPVEDKKYSEEQLNKMTLGQLRKLATAYKIDHIVDMKSNYKVDYINDILQSYMTPHNYKPHESAVAKYGKMLQERKLASMPMEKKVEYLVSMIRG